MFDIFDILVPALASSPRVTVVPDQDSSAANDAKLVYVDDDCFARMLRADVAYSNLLPWTGAPGRGSWSALMADSSANKASVDNMAWATFLDELVFVLQLHTTWYVTCESLCETAELDELVVSASELAQVLDRYRSDKEFMSFRASPRED